MLASIIFYFNKIFINVLRHTSPFCILSQRRFLTCKCCSSVCNHESQVKMCKKSFWNALFILIFIRDLYQISCLLWENFHPHEIKHFYFVLNITIDITQEYLFQMEFKQNFGKGFGTWFLLFNASANDVGKIKTGFTYYTLMWSIYRIHYLEAFIFYLCSHFCAFNSFFWTQSGLPLQQKSVTQGLR